MIVERMTIRAKQGRTEELADLVASEVVAQRKRGPRAQACRIHTPNIGPHHDLVVVDWEWVDLADYERFWLQWGQLSTTPEFFRKWDELAEPGWTNEIWNLRAL